MTEVWPDPQCRYQFPAGIPENVDRWQKAIEAALQRGTMRLTSLHDDTYILSGGCPRCGHEMSNVLEFIVIRKRKLEEERTRSSFDVVCTCEEAHGGRKEDTPGGCGWGRGLRTVLLKPRA